MVRGERALLWKMIGVGDYERKKGDWSHILREEKDVSSFGVGEVEANTLFIAL